MNVKFVVEGSEEQGTGGLDQFVEANPEVLRADAILICDTGNFELGLPTLTSSLRGIANVVVNVKTLAGAQHSGVYGGAAPDALTALIKMLSGLTDANGNTTIEGLDASQVWDGVEYPPAQFAADAGVLEGVGLAGDGSVPEMVWARPTVTVLGIDAPTVAGAGNTVSAEASAKVSVRVPPGMTGAEARDALTRQLESTAPWGAKVTVTSEAVADPFTAAHDGPAYDALVAAMKRELRQGRRHAGTGRIDPALQSLAGALPAGRDHADRHRGAALPDPRAGRISRPVRGREDRACAGAVLQRFSAPSR